MALTNPIAISDGPRSPFSVSPSSAIAEATAKNTEWTSTASETSKRKPIISSGRTNAHAAQPCSWRVKATANAYCANMNVITVALTCLRTHVTVPPIHGRRPFRTTRKT